MKPICNINVTRIPILFIISSILVTSCQREYKEASGMMWNTTYNIKYSSDKELGDSIITVMKQVEQSLSPFKQSSIISRINRGESAEPDSMVFEVFKASQAINKASGGAFDPTVGPLVSLWGFGEKGYDGRVPSQAEIDSALISVGINRCHIKGKNIIKPSPDTRFNFSAITKGYGCDKVAEMLHRNGCTDYMVEIGGEISLSGKNPHGKPWLIMIDAPIQDNNGVIHQKMATVAITNCGVATSGNYRNYHEGENGKKYGHTISPITGHPIETNTLSATIIAPSAMLADALATSCMVMKPDEAIRMVDGMNGCEALLVVKQKDETLTMITSKGFPEMK